MYISKCYIVTHINTCRLKLKTNRIINCYHLYFELKNNIHRRHVILQNLLEVKSLPESLITPMLLNQTSTDAWRTAFIAEHVKFRQSHSISLPGLSSFFVL